MPICWVSAASILSMEQGGLSYRVFCFNLPCCFHVFVYRICLVVAGQDTQPHFSDNNNMLQRSSDIYYCSGHRAAVHLCSVRRWWAPPPQHLHVPQTTGASRRVSPSPTPLVEVSICLCWVAWLSWVVSWAHRLHRQATRFGCAGTFINLTSKLNALQGFIIQVKILPILKHDSRIMTKTKIIIWRDWLFPEIFWSLDHKGDSVQAWNFIKVGPFIWNLISNFFQKSRKRHL